jgi:lauroyl/myristoyl acyltransferase
LVALAGSIPMLRWKVREKMCLALGNDVPAHAESLYFRHLGWYLSSSLSTFHYGVAATAVPEEIKFDESVRLLDDAVAEGRGVVLTSPHWSGHELVAAIINRRHPMVMLVRQAPTSERATRKLKWYNALGAETVLRPSGASRIEDAVAYLRILKRGKLLAVTPDLLAAPGQGVETCIFGRPARLHGGAFALAILARAPMIRVSGRWQPDSTAMVMFDRAPLTFDASDRDAAIRAGVQDWCRWFEEKLRANPENWLFWLDKRWSHFLRTTPRTSGAQ